MTTDPATSARAPTLAHVQRIDEAAGLANRAVELTVAWVRRQVESTQMVEEAALDHYHETRKRIDGEAATRQEQTRLWFTASVADALQPLASRSTPWPLAFLPWDDLAWQAVLPINELSDSELNSTQSRRIL